MSPSIGPRFGESIENASQDARIFEDTEKSASSTHLPPQRSTWASITLIATCTLATILNAASSSAVSIALPAIGRDLDIPEYRLQWVISAYSLSSGCLLLFFGRLADLFGRKYTFLLGTIFLAAFALGCGLAQSEIAIDVLRAFQGMGAAACIPAGLGILAHSFPPSRTRSIAFAAFAAGAPVGSAIGSAIGGVLTQLTSPSWRSTFYFLTGLSALCFLMGVISIDKDDPSVGQDRRVDWLGAFLITAGLVMIVFILSDGSIAPDGWKTGYIIALLVVGVILVGLFLIWEHYLECLLADNAPRTWWTPPPLMRISLWARAKGKLAVVLFIAFLEYGSFLSFLFWLQLYYQDYAHLSPVLTMVRLIPMFVTGVLCNILVALVVGHVITRLSTIGHALTAVANLLIAVINPSAPYWAFGFPAAVVSVFGADFVFAAGTLFVAKVCLPHEQSVGGALFQTMTQASAAFGLAISTIVFNSTLIKQSRAFGVVVNQSGTNAPLPAQLVAYKNAMWTGFAFGILGTILAALFLRGVGVVGHRKPSDETEERTARDEGDYDDKSVTPRAQSSASNRKVDLGPKASG
ncbi:hypothetical protein A0H81_07345 [Grifola frondosa]|uniref:Major facilitator superfamily (MFS) profile domain-containing protein n=1 Tax=Grifola frondosa TaxID=5627 RepID=A0A1C7MBJ9_GRIFR|nr:hypothetical protein A0H81_07345 [Grifola frondosa]